MRINTLTEIPAGQVREIAPEKGGTGFAQRLESALADVNVKQQVADDSMEKVVRGEMGLHEGMLAIQEADISLRAMMQVRAKAMQAYNEIMKMPV